MTPPPSSDHNPGIAAWRILLRMLAAFFALFCFAFWAAAGWNQGWTKTQLPVKQIDEVTGIEFVVYQDHFSPGVELVALGLFVSTALFAVTFIRSKQKPTQP